MFWMICPNLEESILSPLIELIIISESPSTITVLKPTSWANPNAQLAANTSTISIKANSGICCDRVSITNPWSLRIIMRVQQCSPMRKSAPSKLTLTQPTGGGHHQTDLVVKVSLCGWDGVAIQAMELSFLRGIMSSPTPILFLFIHIKETVVAKKSIQDLSWRASWNLKDI